ncbi:Endonuclease/exonuclease/phosphatase [Annulohypoxylon truncatum]|uniref:Endonuclease/exonuclease/phosphatase n=1 Tax=Annulohypoxylon truncatum TaxID=327061 RepID=UPI00200760AF|nr:Endonuclease/exonuclease/phosphatase [Annulohypoxylon truncatum]KAI1209243.1 Endonuclease/exonuclease/phosphatase [Annulohypoxylon truncatum]
MKFGSLFAYVLAAADVARTASLPIRIVSFNIRYAATSLETNEKPWSDRRTGLINQLKTVTDNATSDGAVAVLGLQEVLDAQLKDIKSGLGSAWTHYGFGRDDGAKSGEYNPIIYRTDVLKLLYSEQKWLSPTPDKVSFGWGAGSRRVSVIAVFEHIATGKRFIHANTHLDNVSSQARSEGIKVVVSRIQAVQEQYGPLGVTLTGDFNSAPGEDAYTTLSDTGYLTELWNSGATRLGTNQLTYTGFSTTGKSRIDFVWLGPTADKLYSAQQFEFLNNYIDNVFISDHRAVVADLTIL